MHCKLFFMQMKVNLWELKYSYGFDFMAMETLGEELVSHIVFNKLPGFFKRDMIRLSGCNYPTISFLIEHFSDVIRTLDCARNEPVDSPKPTICKANPLPCRNKTCLQNLNTNYVPRRGVFKCNLCYSNACPLSLYMP